MTGGYGRDRDDRLSWLLRGGLVRPRRSGPPLAVIDTPPPGTAHGAFERANWCSTRLTTTQCFGHRFDHHLDLSKRKRSAIYNFAELLGR